MPSSPAKERDDVPWRFPENWINEEHTVLGFRLRPFCLWYRLLFEITKSPFLYGGKPTFVDLYAAVRMCRMDFGHWLRSRPLSVMEKWRIARLSRRFDLAEESEKLSAYLKDYFSPPEFWHRTRAAGSDDGLPPETGFIAAQVIVATGWDEERVWMLPLGKAYWYAALFARIGGTDIRFVSESDDDFAALKRLRDEYRAKKSRRNPPA